MPVDFERKRFPGSRIATRDVYSVGKQKHHVSALLEFDVTEIRRQLRELRKSGTNISFNAWLVTAICRAISQHPDAAAYLSGKRSLLSFKELRVSMLVEKMVDGQRVPLPLVIEDAAGKTAEEITRTIENAREEHSDKKAVVIQRTSTPGERMYYYLPGFLRRTVWRIMLRYPKLTFRKMGNVVITSVGMAGKINGWFIHSSVHPVSFGIGSVLRKPVAVGDEIRVREILHMTVLVDHDVIDGAPMVRMLNDLSHEIESPREKK